jgi:site-specific DNA-cytosine methylase
MSSEMERTLCNELLDKGLVSEGDVIRHSYTRNRLDNGVENMSRTESKEKLSPTLDTRCDCLGVVVKEPSKLQKEVGNQAIEKGLLKPYDIIDYTYSNARLDEIKNGKIHTKNSENNQIANTLTTNAENMGVCVPNLRIRKLTPKECWRLMGFNDEDFAKAEKVCSNSQLYKQAGNSIVVNVLMAIFKELFVPKQTRSEWLDELLGDA